MTSGFQPTSPFSLGSSLGGAYNGRFVVVVDDDIDPTSEFDVLWTMATRCDPESARRDHPPLRQRCSGRLHSPGKQGTQLALSDRCLHAVRPPPSVSAHREVEQRTKTSSA